MFKKSFVWFTQGGWVLLLLNPLTFCVLISFMITHIEGCYGPCPD